MIGNSSDEVANAKKSFMDALIWGATIVPLLHTVSDLMNATMPSRKKKKGKLAPEIE